MGNPQANGQVQNGILYPITYGPEGSYINVAKRYEEITPIVIEGAQRNVYNFLDVAKRDFWAATGFAALRGQGIINSNEIDARGRKMWREFTHKYGDSQVRAQRDKYKTHLAIVTKKFPKPDQIAA
ncbi:hypothetical protein HYW35_02565 [Candidatus Saccharibacteria bacterium]|nr:hypothetical protein [Candidatus Saccharibacteria bacterium]